MVKISAKKKAYRARLEKYLEEYSKILIINVDNVGSNQIQQVRIALREPKVESKMLLGKNTIIRMVLRELIPNHPEYEGLLNLVKGNMGFIFTNQDLNEVRELVVNNKVPAAARAGAIAPVDVFIPPGPTGLDPGQTSYFQALNIGTKIARGSIEIVSRVHILRAGDKVTASATSLLSKLGIKPFFFGIKTLSVYDNGSIYDAAVLDLSEQDLLDKFFNGVNRLAALSLRINHSNAATVIHQISNSFKKLLAISVATDYTFEESKSIKEFLENPDAFVSANKEEEKEDGGNDAGNDDDDDDDESSSGGGGLGGGLFGDSDDDSDSD